MNKKKEFRKLCKSIRNRIGFDERLLFDSMIFTHLINSDLYNNSNTLLIYVSVNNEVDTLNIIKHALADGKRVAVPQCESSIMNFVAMNSFEDLSEGDFGIPTVDSENIKIINDFSDALCIVPGLGFDRYGNRLGYGGGYYDRFLSCNHVTSVGLCYERCRFDMLPAEEHDVKTDYILTENGLRNSKKEVST